MAIEKKEINDLLDQIDEVVAELIEQMSLLEDGDVNTVPYQGSWTAGELFEHVTKSSEGLAQAMQTEGLPAERDPGEHIENLKNMFLDFSTKMNAPDFIVPVEGSYEKSKSIQNLGASFQHLRLATKNAGDLTIIIKGSPLGDATKWEMLNFVLFHTQRHLNQMKKIHEALKNRV